MEYNGPEMWSLEWCESLQWGTRGKSGNEPLRMVRLGECSSDHLEKIALHLIIDQRRSEQSDYVRACRKILEHRRYSLPEELFEL